MKFFERFRRRNAGKSRPEAGTPHAFEPVDDVGMGAAFSGLGGGYGGQPLGMNAAVTGSFVRELRCGVPGCERERHDPIHWPVA